MFSKLKKFTSPLITLALALALVPLAAPSVSAALENLSPGFSFLQNAETKANAVAQRSNQPIAIEHFEIPLEIIEKDMSLRIDPQIASSLVFTKEDGKRYVRWIINPEDTKWSKDVVTLLEKKGVPVIKGQYFTGYQTASRSYIVIDPATGVEFSVKVSTNVTGGNWVDKKQTWEDAWQVRMAYNYAVEVIAQHGGLKHAIFIDESAAFGLKEIDQGMLIRNYDVLKNGKTKLIPGFSVLHEKVGAEIARKNGSSDPAAFWNENYNKPLARALAEVYAITGLSYDSPHSQNFLVELDGNNKPTGRIALRDIGDAYMVNDVFAASGAKHAGIPARWEADNIIKGRMNVGVGVMHGNTPPSWLDVKEKSQAKNSYNMWGKDFYAEFEATFKNVTGVDISGGSDMSRRSMYFGKNYALNSASGKAYLDWIRAGRPKISQAVVCRDLFKKSSKAM